MVKILIIDDDPSVTGLLQEFLSKEGYTAQVCHEARSGLEQALKAPPDLIMLDIVLPDSTGFQVCWRLRNNTVTRQIPIILMSGDVRLPEQQGFGKQTGANAYILKPFSVDEVGEQIRKLLGIKAPASTPPPSFHVEKFPTPEEIVPVPVEPLKPAPVATPKPAPIEVPKPSPVEAPKSGDRLDSEQRYFDFSVEVLGLAAKLDRTHAEMFLANQLLRCGTAVGARIHEAKFLQGKPEYVPVLKSALKELQETSYWFMLCRQADIFNSISPGHLEDTCKELAADLGELINSKKTV